MTQAHASIHIASIVSAVLGLPDEKRTGRDSEQGSGKAKEDFDFSCLHSTFTSR
jgi:hypothetical protein